MRLLALGAVLLAAMTAAPAHACSCLAIDPPTAFAQADAVFEGRVLDIERNGAVMRVTMAVVQQWKGIDGERVVVQTPEQSAACGVAFEPDTSWLVYAQTDESGQLSASLCSRTTRIERAQEDLAALGAGVVPVDIGPEDGVEEEARRESPARGGCASCALAGGASSRGALAVGVALLSLLGLRRRHARARRR